MPNLGDSYTTGKGGEKDTWVYLQAKGFVRPTRQERVKIEELFRQKGITINKRGFDVISTKGRDDLGAGTVPMLYEVKSCGAKRGLEVSDGFKGLGFTLTTAEKQNADAIGEGYRFIFVNVAKSRHTELLLTDFFKTPPASIYQTWSVFIKADL